MPEAEPIRVVVVEDHALTRSGLIAALRTDGRCTVVGEAENGPNGLRVVRDTHPAVAIVDIGLPGFDGIELTRRIRSEVPATRVVILTMHDLDEEILAALAAGADAYCVKSSEPGRVITAATIVAEGGAYFDPHIAHVVLRSVASAAPPKPDEPSPLTPRQLDVLRLIADGLGNTEIGDRLHMSLGTVKTHIRDILEKLSATDRTHAAVVALRKGLI